MRTEKSPNAVLTGGPNDLPDSERIRHVDPHDAHVRVLRGNTYEHFLRTPDTTEGVDGSPLRVFRWDYRTRVAE